MKYKIITLSVASIVLIGLSAFLVSASLSPDSTSSLNAKREYAPAFGISKQSLGKLESNIARPTLTFPNAKRESI